MLIGVGPTRISPRMAPLIVANPKLDLRMLDHVTSTLELTRAGHGLAENRPQADCILPDDSGPSYYVLLGRIAGGTTDRAQHWGQR